MVLAYGSQSIAIIELQEKDLVRNGGVFFDFSFHSQHQVKRKEAPDNEGFFLTGW